MTVICGLGTYKMVTRQTAQANFKMNVNEHGIWGFCEEFKGTLYLTYKY